MRKPITLVLLLPIILLCFFSFGDSWGYGFVPLVTLAFLLEIKVKKGSLSKQNIKEFFNTPIKPRPLTGEELKPNPNLEERFSAVGLFVILGWLFVSPYFGIKLYTEYKGWNFPVEVETILIMTYLIGLGILYRIFFIKTKNKNEI